MDEDDLLIIFLFLCLNDRCGNPIQISLSRVSDSSSTLLLIKLNNANFCERLEAFAVYRA